MKIYSTLERILAFITILILSPFFLVIGLLVFFEDGFPIIFTQKRFGRGNIFFNMYKFRTMKTNTPNVATNLLKNPNKYKLKVGGFLRKFSLDELPNLINIIKGDMSFVGPRPALYNQDDLIRLRRISGISKLKPGLTGWAQINGRDKLSLNQKIVLEKEYLDKKNFSFDVKIFFRTFIFVFFRNDDVNH